MLIAAGLGPEDVVGLALPRSPLWVEAVLGVLKAGAAFLPLDMSAPPARIAALVAQSGAKAVLADVEHVTQLPALPAPVLLEDRVLARYRADSPANSDRKIAINPQHPAYVLFTSGSTGAPKGVVVAHRSIADYVAVVRNILGAHALRMPLFTATAFDLTLTSLFVPLAAGGVVEVFGEEAPEAALRHIFAPDSAMEAVKLTPAHAALLDTLPIAQNQNLHLAIIGGEALTGAHVRALQARAPRLRVLNEYGPTEATIGAVAGFASVDDVAIGKPYPGVEALVLDERLLACPIGVVGELYLGGRGIARGYHQAPARTAERFVAHPYARGLRLYRTGDLAAWRADGALAYHGRADDQIKLRGLRIEPGEIEAALAALPGIAQTAVVLRSDQGEARLVAYIVPTASISQDDFDPEELRGQLREILPPGMIPDLFVALPRLPLTSNGKIDRRVLPVPDFDASPYVAPRTTEERLLCAVLAGLLARSRIGRDDHFFRIGGHSLLAARLAAQIRDHTGAILPLKAIFQNPVIKDLAQTLAAIARSPGEALHADAANAHSPFPLTPAQQAYWIGRQNIVALGGVACHAYTEYAIRNLDVERLCRTWNAVIARHPMLRAVVDATGNQHILDSIPPVAVPVSDFRELSSGEASAALLRLREAMSHQILPADTGPLVEMRATRISNEDWRLHFSADALILDGESTALLLEELFSLYCGSRSLLPASHVTFRDYVLHRAADAAQRLQAEAYWRARIGTMPRPPALPVATAPARLADRRFRRWHAHLAADVWSKLKRRAAKAGLTPSAVLLAAYAEVIAGWTRSDSFTLNITVGDREIVHPEVAGMLGVFTTLTPLAIAQARTGAFKIRAEAQQIQLASDLDQRAFNGVDVQRLIAQQAGDPEAGLLPVVFTSLLGETGFCPEEHGLEPVYGITQTPQTWLDNKVYENGRERPELHIDWDAPAALFPDGLLDVMFDTYVGLLRRLAHEDAAWSDPNRSLLPASQRELFETVNDTKGSLPDDLLHDPVFAAIGAYPERVALCAGIADISFAELGDRVRHLACALETRLTPGDKLVAVIMEKGVEQIVAVLAILAIGRAFLPISAGQPDQRIETILSTAGARVAITQAHLRRDRSWRERIDVVDVDLHQEYKPPSILPVTPRVEPDGLAYVIYTSGSTGQPKGVAISHRAARNTLAGMADRFALSPRDSVLWVSSLEFDLSIFDIFAVLGAGGCVVIPPPDASRAPNVLCDAIVSHGVTIWNSAPAIAELMLSAISEKDEARFSSLRLVLFSGDWIAVNLPERMTRQAPNAQIVALGGATEASIWSIFHSVDRVDPAWTSIPYGKPLRNQGLHVLRDDLSPCPVYVSGKLYISGAGLALGYWNDAGQTDARFIRHPESGERLYDTGDLGRYCPDGTIEFLGREDHQVKLRGFRIELGEIEAALMSHPDVQAAAVALQARNGSNSLIGYVVPRQSVYGHTAGATILDPAGRAAFTLAQHGRPARTGPLLKLPNGAFTEARKAAFVARQSYRRFRGWRDYAGRTWRMAWRRAGDAGRGCTPAQTPLRFGRWALSCSDLPLGKAGERQRPRWWRLDL